MPIHDLGYRGWLGERTDPSSRWRVIAGSGVRLAWKNAGLRRILLAAWGPALVASVVFLGFERTIETGTPQQRKAFVVGLGRRIPPNWRNEQVFKQMAGDVEGSRHLFWSYIIMTFFRYPQSFMLVIVMALVAPSLISRDLRSRAFLLYFSRPLGRIQYVVGKAAVLWLYLALITTFPGLVTYVVGVLFSPSLSVVWETWDLPLRVIGASLVLLLPTSALALCLSSMTTESRYAGFSWFVLWILGFVAYTNLAMIDLEHAARWTPLSLYHSLGKVQGYVFGLEPLSEAYVPAILLMVITVVSLLITFRRVAAPMQV